ncbi:RDD family protein [uncultured Cohaesibacter sp.]|uniref:RDD family protein n=1 Tax=uncultured Cohaesibacter sp. TaxID=1002546 RepID=UPI0029C8CF31|nr:RDD family protein [uncultured Cohaesibacter sp.]
MNNAHTAYDNSDERRNAFDPGLHPALFDGVLSRRVLAFLIDAFVILILMVIASMAIAVIGVITFGLGWLLYAILLPLVALPYIALSLGGYSAATPGMKMMGLEMRLWYGAKPYAMLAIMHSLLFWFGNTILTPLIILVGLFTRRKQLLHDMILGTMIMDSDALRQLEGYDQF